VDFIAEAIATLGAGMENGYQTYHVLNPYDDGIGFDQFVDWLNGAGCPIQRIADYNDWLQRFETAMRALPERQRQHSVLPLLHYYAERWRRPNASTPRCRRRKSARTKTSHTLRPSSSSNT
jgi:fatty acid CoA ligase FadD9